MNGWSGLSVNLGNALPIVKIQAGRGYGGFPECKLPASVRCRSRVAERAVYKKINAWPESDFDALTE